MIAHRLILAAAVCLLLLGGCSGNHDDADAGAATADASDGSQAEETDEPRTFAAGDPIPASLTLLASEDGGRRTGIFGGYRGSVTFAQHDPLTCALGGWSQGGAFEPGETHDVVLTCEEDITVEPEGIDLAVEEGGRLIGSGTVLP